MRVILGAVEMYGMDNKVQIQTLDKKTLEMLEKGKYLKSPVTPPDIDCSYFGKDLDKSGESANRIRCRIHGSVEDVQNFVEEYQSTQKMRTTILWGSGITIFLVILVSVFWGRKPSA